MTNDPTASIADVARVLVALWIVVIASWHILRSNHKRTAFWAFLSHVVLFGLLWMAGFWDGGSSR